MWQSLRINMSDFTIVKEEFGDLYMGLGGRGLIAKLLTEEVDPKCDPLGEKNKLIFCTGIFAGLGLTCANRLSVGGKSPLTNGVKESNVGGTTGTYMANLGIRMIIIEGKPENQNGLWILRIDANGEPHLENAMEYAMVNNYELTKKLFERFGTNISITSIGSAGERQYRNSSIQCTENGTGYPCRAAARGGLGAVMGSKRIKAVVIEKAAQRYKHEYKGDENTFAALRKEINKQIAETAKKSAISIVGTASIVDNTSRNGAMPVRNFSGEKFENAEKIGSSAFMDLITKQGKNKHACQPGCLVRCSNIINDTDGKYVTGGLEYETIALFGPNCDVDNLETIAKMDRACDDIGLDTIDTGAAFGVCMDAGVIKWGDVDAMMGLFQEIVKGTDFGRILGDGCEATGRHLNWRRIPTCKNQAMSGYDPRAQRGTGTTYATCTMGADHTAGYIRSTDRREAFPVENVAEMSLDAQHKMGIRDSVICGFAFAPLLAQMDVFVQMYASVYGGEPEVSRVLALGTDTFRLERAFNTAAGWRPEDNKIPEFFYKEKNRVVDDVFDIPPERLQQFGL